MDGPLSFLYFSRRWLLMVDVTYLFLASPRCHLRCEMGRKQASFIPSPPAANNAASSHLIPHRLSVSHHARSVPMPPVCMSANVIGGSGSGLPPSPVDTFLGHRPCNGITHRPPRRANRICRTIHERAGVNRSLPRNSHPSPSHPKRSERREGQSFL